MNLGVYHGYFWFPVDDKDKPIETVFSGTFTYNKNELILEIHYPNIKEYFDKFRYPLLHGEIGDECPITFFDFSMSQWEGDSFIRGYAKYAVIGKHLNSFNEDEISKCNVKYQYINEWIKPDCFYWKLGEIETITIDKPKTHIPKLIMDINEDTVLTLHSGLTIHNVINYNYSINLHFVLKIISLNKKTINDIIDLVGEFSQFMSFVLQSKQYPEQIIYDGEFELLFNYKESTKPKYPPLIPFDLFKDKLSEMYKVWHNVFSELLPLCKYYINSLCYDDFDIPDFVFVAHALDGYYKRFISNKRMSYENKLKDLIEKRFNDIDIIKECDIDTEVFKDSRDKYSHWIPDSEQIKSVGGRELYLLTQKGVILLTCCFLNLLGLNNEEINICCKNARLQNRLNIL